MNRTRPFLSVIMPSYNSARFLSESISSILTQTLTDFELILVDDCSTDGSPDIAQASASMDSRVRVTSTDRNSGAALARNHGIELARGQWIAMADSDDIAEPTRFERQIALTSAHESLVLIGSDSVGVDIEGRASRTHRYPTKHGALARRLLTNRAFPPHSSMIYRREQLVALNGFDARYEPAEDYELWLRLSETGRLASIGEPLVRIRRHPSSISHLEGGHRQLRHSMAAAICHRLRRNGGRSPAEVSDGRWWAEFIEWLDSRLDEEGAYSLQEAWDSTFRPGRETKFDLTRRVMASGKPFAMLRRAWLGSPLPDRFAAEWEHTKGADSPTTGRDYDEA